MAVQSNLCGKHYADRRACVSGNFLTVLVL